MTVIRKTSWIWAALCTLLGAALFMGLWLPGGLLLRVVPVRGGRPLAEIALHPQERFTIRYMHSVENAPIWETHSVDANGRIYIEEERYLKFGAGMGKMPGVGRMVRRGPYEVIEAMHMPTGNFVLRIGSPGVDHTLMARSRELNLSAIAPHTAVQFSAHPISRLRRVWRGWYKRSTPWDTAEIQKD
jgi:hypothetical protein